VREYTTMSMQHRNAFTILEAALAVTALGSGCGHLRQARDQAAPYAVPTVRAEQTLNPEAGKNRKVVAGLDGSAAVNVGEGYAKSFEREQGQSTEGFQGLSSLSSD
jgi:hypothetical protein